MKKLLALVLALVMTMGLATISSNAAFSDQDKIDHTEAVDVLTSLDIINGMPNGSFDPTGDVTRAQMAKMIAIIMLGADVNDSAFVGVPSTLTDINGHWAEGFIKYCVSQGIVAGKGDGTFKPDDKVTTTEAAKMLLVALGYNSDVQGYTGEQWAINVTKDASVKKLFEKLTGMAATKAVNRDEAAQMIWNTLQRGMIIKTAGQERTSDGKITDSYHDTSYDANPVTLLGQTFEGQVWIGTFEGNDKMLAALDDNSIRVNGALEANYTGIGGAGYINAEFPWTAYGIDNIGEETKVIFKDGTSGAANRPDRFDTIYGVFNTGTTRVVNATRDDIGDTLKGTNNDKLEINKVNYDILGFAAGAPTAAGDITINFGGYGLANATGGSLAVPAAWTALNVQTGDNVKFILDDNSRIVNAYLTQSKINKITGVNGSKITIQGFGAIDFSENGSQIYSGAAVDDVVVVTQFYEPATKDATFVVTKAETITGKITGYNGTEKVTIDGTQYKVHNKAYPAVDLTDDALTNLGDEIGTEVKAYMINGMVGALQKISADDSKYALLTSDNGIGTNGVNTGKVELLQADGTKKVYDLNKDSDWEPDATAAGGFSTAAKTWDAGAPTLVKFSLKSDGSVNIKEAYNVGATPNPGTFWDKDTKVVNAGAGRTGVTTEDCVLFVTTNAGGTEFKAYSIRGLKAISSTGQNAAVAMNDSNQVVAAFFYQGSTVNNSDTIYGYVTSVDGIVKHGDDEYRQVTVWTGSESLPIYIKSTVAAGTALDAADASKGVMPAKRDFISFNSAANYEYDGGIGSSDFVDVSATVNIPAGDTRVITDGVVDKYRPGDKTLTIFTATNLSGDGVTYEGTAGTAVTIALDSDCKIVYVNTDDCEAGVETGIMGFDTSTGYANVKVVQEKANGNAVAIYVESDGEFSINHTQANL